MSELKLEKYTVTILTRPEDTTYWTMSFDALNFGHAATLAYQYLASYHEIVKVEKDWSPSNAE